LTVLARVLWLQGLPEQAWRAARQALDIAVQINHGTSICYTLALASCLIAHYNGDRESARALLQLLLEQSQKHSVLLFNNWGRHYAQVIDPDNAAPVSAQSSGLIREVMVTLDERFVDDALVERARNGDAGWSAAEILRARAAALLMGSEKPLREQARESALSDTAETREAEQTLQQALTIARSQGALAWELRSATDLAELWHRQSRYRDALDLLNPIYQRFTEGYATPDLCKVRRLLDRLRDQCPA
jgi:predicted ATPase